MDKPIEVYVVKFKTREGSLKYGIVTDSEGLGRFESVAAVAQSLRAQHKAFDPIAGPSSMRISFKPPFEIYAPNGFAPRLVVKLSGPEKAAFWGVFNAEA